MASADLYEVKQCQNLKELLVFDTALFQFLLELSAPAGALFAVM